MRFIVLGAAGRMGSMHAKHLQELGHEIKGFDIVRGFDGNDEWWLEPADGVVIATPAELHAEHLTKAVQHGFHVFIEKPICLIDHLNDARRSVGRAIDKSLVVIVGYNLRFHQIIKQVKRLSLKVEFATFMMKQAPSRPLSHFLEEWASHEIDLAMHLLGNWNDAKLISRLSGPEEVRLMIRHGPTISNPVSLIIVDAWSSPFVRSFTLVDENGHSVTHDIESDHVRPEHYKDEIEEWVRRIEVKKADGFLPGISTPLAATGIDGLAVIDLLQHLTVKNGHRKSEYDRS